MVVTKTMSKFDLNNLKVAADQRRLAGTDVLDQIMNELTSMVPTAERSGDHYNVELDLLGKYDWFTANTYAKSAVDRYKQQLPTGWKLSAYCHSDQRDGNISKLILTFPA